MADELDDLLDYKLSDSDDERADIVSIDEDEASVSKSSALKGRSSAPSNLAVKSRSEDAKDAGEPPRKKGKKNSGSSLHDKRKAVMEQQAAQKRDIGRLSPAIIADYILNKLKRANSELSVLELQDRAVPESRIVDTSNFTNERGLETFPLFFQHFKLNQSPSVPNALVLVLSISAIRVCDVSRSLRSIQNGALKLITKNKLEYDQKALASPSFVAVSTPGRVRKLTAQKTLDINRVGVVVVDSTFLDIKKLSVWDLPETIPLISELAQKGAKVYLF